MSNSTSIQSCWGKEFTIERYLSIFLIKSWLKDLTDIPQSNIVLENFFCPVNFLATHTKYQYLYLFDVPSTISSKQPYNSQSII